MGDMMRDNKGLTLIELVVAIAIISSIIMAISSFYISGVKGFARETTTASNQTEVRRVSNEIAREIRRASSVVNFSFGTIRLRYPDDKGIWYYLSENTLIADYGLYTSDTSDTNMDTYYTSILSDRIGSFNVNIVGDNITITIESIENSEGETYKLVTELYLRK